MRNVFITAGHNGSGTGANGFIDEGAETIWLRDCVVKKLAANGVKAEIDQNKMSLSGVVSWIKKALNKTDIVVDLHFNAANKKARGVEVLISKEGTIEKPMAEELCKKISETLGTTNRGVKGESSGHHSKLAMLSNFEAEQMILEVCFCDNQEDSDAYNSKRWLVAQDIADVVAKYAV